MAEIRFALDELERRLPPVCMACGEPAVFVRSRRMSWWPRWTYWLVIVHPVVCVIVAMILTRRVWVHGCFCQRHRNHWHTRRLITWSAGTILGLLAGAAFIVAGNLFAPDTAEWAILAILGGVGFLVLWLTVIAIAHQWEIRAKAITRSEIVLTGVAETFVDAVEKADRAHLARPFGPDSDDRDWAERVPPRRRMQPWAKAMVSERPYRQYLKDALEPEPRKPPVSDAIQK